MMENFFDEELPSFLYTFVVGGPTFSTEIQSSNGKREIRFANHVSPINKYKITNCKLTAQQISDLQRFFCKAQGKKYAFRLRDTHDCKAQNQPLLILNEKNLEFQLVKSYTKMSQDAANEPHRKILAPVKESVKIFVDKKRTRELQSTINDFGVVKIEEEILEKDIPLLRADFDFDLPVRFDTDALKYKSELDFCASVEPFEIIEVLK